MKLKIKIRIGIWASPPIITLVSELRHLEYNKNLKIFKHKIYLSMVFVK